MAPDESLWQAAARPEGVTSGTFYSRFRRYLKTSGLAPTGIHVLRHTAAKLRRDAGESIEDVSAFLDHSSLAVTTVYLRRLEGQEDRAWRDVAEAIGVCADPRAAGRDRARRRGHRQSRGSAGLDGPSNCHRPFSDRASDA